MKRFEYNTDGADTHHNSSAIIREKSDLSHFDADEETIAVRMIHAAGQTDLAKDIVFSPRAIHTICQALEDGAPIFIDVSMIASGVARKRLPVGSEVICLLRDGRIPELAQELGTTRTAAAVELWKTHLENTVVAIGNTPTALFHLLNRINKGSFPMPAIILAMLVGFVGAAESRRATIDSGAESPGLKYIIVTSRRGDSAITCAALNAIATAKEIL